MVRILGCGHLPVRQVSIEKWPDRGQSGKQGEAGWTRKGRGPLKVGGCFVQTGALEEELLKGPDTSGPTILLTTGTREVANQSCGKLLKKSWLLGSQNIQTQMNLPKSARWSQADFLHSHLLGKCFRRKRVARLVFFVE